MIEIAQGINSFLPSEVVSIPVSILNALVDQVQSLTAKVEALERRHDDSQETLNLNIAQDRKRISQLESTKDTPAPAKGSKTAARIDAIDRTLKERGATTLKEICRILKILPQELSRIMRGLDKRRYALSPRPGDLRQKVLKLRAWIA